MPVNYILSSYAFRYTIITFYSGYAKCHHPAHQRKDIAARADKSVVGHSLRSSDIHIAASVGAVIKMHRGEQYCWDFKNIVTCELRIVQQTKIFNQKQSCGQKFTTHLVQKAMSYYLKLNVLNPGPGVPSLLHIFVFSLLQHTQSNSGRAFKGAIVNYFISSFIDSHCPVKIYFLYSLHQTCLTCTSCDSVTTVIGPFTWHHVSSDTFTAAPSSP